MLSRLLVRLFLALILLFLTHGISTADIFQQDFEIRYSTYDSSEKSILSRHVAQAKIGLPPEPSEYEIAAAFNAYIYRNLKRADGASGKGTVDILTQGEAVCGGMVVTLAEMLYSVGIKSRFAFLVGGNAAHSMLEVSFNNNESGLFDPYHGIAYYDQERHHPVSITQVESYIDEKIMQPVLFVRKKAQPVFNTREYLAANYSTHDTENRVDYNFSQIFKRAHAAGIANTGLYTTINIMLEPKQFVGVRSWNRSKGARPWTRIAQWKLANGEYLSWAYIMGQTSLGYVVEHVYTLKGLKVGKKYSLILIVANAYKNDQGRTSGPAITLQPVAPFADATFEVLENRGFSDDTYSPQIVRHTFTATKTEMVVIGQGTGDFVLQGIGLDTLDYGDNSSISLGERVISLR